MGNDSEIKLSIFSCIDILQLFMYILRKISLRFDNKVVFVIFECVRCFEFESTLVQTVKQTNKKSINCFQITIAYRWQVIYGDSCNSLTLNGCFKISKYAHDYDVRTNVKVNFQFQLNKHHYCNWLMSILINKYSAVKHMFSSSRRFFCSLSSDFKLRFAHTQYYNHKR